MIERQTIDGKPAMVAYLDDDLMPCDKAKATRVCVLFDDGRSVWSRVADVTLREDRPPP